MRFYPSSKDPQSWEATSTPNLPNTTQLAGSAHPQITHNVEELNPRPVVPQSGTINQRIPLVLANSPLLI